MNDRKRSPEELMVEILVDHMKQLTVMVEALANKIIDIEDRLVPVEIWKQEINKVWK